jgi:flagellar motor switch protein FliG
VDAFRRLGAVLRTTLLSDHGAVSTPAEGRRRLAEILNSADRDVEHEVLTALSEHDPDLAKQIRDRMFTFEDLVELDPRELQIVLRTVPMEDLRMALQMAGEKLKEHIFANMSERAAAGLKEDMEAAGPSKPHQARAAQQRVAAVARRLAKEGTLTLKSEAESETEPLEAGETSEATVADAPAGDDRSEPATGEARDAE